MTEQAEHTEFIGKKVTVDFRKETGTVEAYSEAEEEVTIFYPDLEFREVINYKLVEVKFTPNQFI